MLRLASLIALALTLSLAGCGLFVSGHVSEHGPNNVKLGVPF